MSFHIVLFAVLLLIVDVLKSGGNILELLGIAVNKKRISSNDSILYEDNDVLNERTDVQNVVDYRNKVVFTNIDVY